MEHRDGLRRMQAAGALRADSDPADLALGLLAAVQGGLLLGQMQRPTPGRCGSPSTR